jgi:hypothetical protein
MVIADERQSNDENGKPNKGHDAVGVVRDICIQALLSLRRTHYYRYLPQGPEPNDATEPTETGVVCATHDYESVITILEILIVEIQKTIGKTIMINESHG